MSDETTDDNMITADAKMLAGVTVLIGQLMHEKGAMEERAHRFETMLDEIDASLGTGFHTSRLDKIAEYRTKNAELATQLVTERSASKTYQSAHTRLTAALDWPEASSPVETVDYVVRSLRGLRKTLGLVEDATLGKICETVERLTSREELLRDILHHVGAVGDPAERLSSIAKRIEHHQKDGSST